jgi:vancomycin permeability regulator SanA
MNWLKVVVLSSVCVSLFTCPALSGNCVGMKTCGENRKTVYYDKQGCVIGTDKTYKSKTVYYNKQGRVIGTSKAYKGKTVYYDKRGHVIGHSVKR